MTHAPRARPDSLTHDALRTLRSAVPGLDEHRLLIYGSRALARELLAGLDPRAVVGVADVTAVGAEVDGHQVLSLTDGLARQPDYVVVAAQPAHAPLVHRRIWRECRARGVSVVGFDGVVTDDPYEALVQLADPGPTVDDLKDRIDEAGSVSFDIFDTLLMRRVLHPDDVFHLVEARPGLCEVSRGFAHWRPQAEVALPAAPHLDDIYRWLRAESPLDPRALSALREAELAVEREVLVARPVMVEALNHAVQRGVPVSLISDMYLPADFLRETLRDRGIVGFEHLLVSGEQGVDKSGGLFSRCPKVAPGRHLHIGDNPYADGQCAQAAGMSTFVIESALSMLTHSTAVWLLNDTAVPADRVALGVLLAEVSHDPFNLPRTQGRILVDSLENLGMLILGPHLHRLCHSGALDPGERAQSERDLIEATAVALDTAPAPTRVAGQVREWLRHSDDGALRQALAMMLNGAWGYVRTCRALLPSPPSAGLVPRLAFDELDPRFVDVTSNVRAHPISQALFIDSDEHPGDFTHA